jgi:hypothetical protein
MVQDRGSRDVDAAHLHDDSSTGKMTAAGRFREAVRGTYLTPEAAWEAFGTIEDTSNGLSRSGFKQVLRNLNLSVSKSEQKEIRRTLDPKNTKRVQQSAFAAFMLLGSSEVSTGIHTILPPLPMNLPQLPEGFCRRLDLEDRIISLLLSEDESGMASCILAQGMGVRQHCIFLAPIP